MIDMHPPPAYIEVAQTQKPGPPLQLLPNQIQTPPPAPGQSGPQPQSLPPSQDQPAQLPPGDGQPEQIDVTPLDVGRYLPHTALFATLVITVTPPTGTVAVFTPGFEDTPVLFKGPRTSGEIRLNGPTVYVHLKDGATGYSVEYLSWREP